MPKPSLTPKVADSRPTADTLTGYDNYPCSQHLVIYLRLLDADGEGAEKTEVARIVLQIDPEQEPAPARPAWESNPPQPAKQA
jgi:hypothetical protein